MILLRHGEGTWNPYFHEVRIDAAIHDPELTETGHLQARAAAERLAGGGFRRLLASPYRRTLETAARIAERLGLDIEVEPLVRERCAFSCDQGSPASVLARDWPMLDFGGLEEIWWGRRIESQASLEGRAGAFMRRMAEAPDVAATVVVTHWGFIRALTGQAIGNAEQVRFMPGGPIRPAEGPEAEARGRGRNAKNQGRNRGMRR